MKCLKFTLTAFKMITPTPFSKRRRETVQFLKYTPQGFFRQDGLFPYNYPIKITSLNELWLSWEQIMFKSQSVPDQQCSGFRGIELPAIGVSQLPPRGGFLSGHKQDTLKSFFQISNCQQWAARTSTLTIGYRRSLRSSRWAHNL